MLSMTKRNKPNMDGGTVIRVRPRTTTSHPRTRRNSTTPESHQKVNHANGWPYLGGELPHVLLEGAAELGLEVVDGLLGRLDHVIARVLQPSDQRLEQLAIVHIRRVANTQNRHRQGALLAHPRLVVEQSTRRVASAGKLGG